MLQRAQPALQPALQDALEHAGANQAIPWQDEASGLSGEIVAAAPYLDGVPCRAVRLTVRSSDRQVAVEGQRCRSPDGQWGAGRLADSIALAPVASPLIRDLQADLKRLAYYDGAVDGVASAAVTASILGFERDEQVPPDAEPTAGLLDLAEAAMGRIPPAGTCDAGAPVADGSAVACGSIR